MDSKRVILALGTNIKQERNMKQVRRLLVDTWPDMKFTTTKRTQAIGMASDLFYNCLAYTKVEESLEDLTEKVKSMEQICGDTRAERSLNRIQMDIDILLYGDNKLHINDWQRDYIQELMKEIEFIKH
ncbi:2-amino-4-hydroxy-6-hydroxymethyldihydropteridine diphosphokinase [Prevotella sp. BV3P1]|uniref:2-amino-4-hydroxy-6- hydroxymethyldihydropteridine diphosphokinase n=1 Tax=Prevotellaceae TaxID=171552 RepID=UPI0003B88700|nr:MULTISPECIES: 2-amino-4-hydroxy-6-hydroxymethyldihydropteridine diphosphokinase [Prevotellaceae]ERT58110.1 2-amino-4-hydroxy-6-hydroxymethyldihydropteridine diphosphokinase [Prevotella sp. BV3P1]KGF40372.1 2-amino-4-hydroxy-6-hydroxymethyldihydropteridine pyrophosphokinase [Hoylesella buccalis DNF00985]